MADRDGGTAVDEYSPRSIGLSLASESWYSLDYRTTTSFRHKWRIFGVTGGDASDAGVFCRDLASWIDPRPG